MGMHLAVIDDSEIFRNSLKERLSPREVDVFNDSVEFSSADLRAYDAIIIDYYLPHMNGLDLAKAIYGKTRASIALTSVDSARLSSKDIVEEKAVAAILHKADFDSIVDWLTFVTVKHKIMDTLNEQESSFSNLFLVTNGMKNGYDVDLHGDVVVVGLSKLLNEEGKRYLLRFISKIGFRVVFQFNELKTATSIHLGQLIHMVGEIKKNKGICALWVDNPVIARTISVCNLDKVIPMFATMSDALHYVRSQGEICTLLDVQHMIMQTPRR